MTDDLEDVLKDYVAHRRLTDGRIIGVMRLLYHWTLHVDIDWSGYHERYCYATMDGAIEAMNAWDGIGDPVGWHRHPTSGRRRDLTTGREWISP